MYSGNNHAGYAGNNKEEQILAGRLSDLANTCYNRNIPVFSAYLNLNEQNILHEIHKNFPPISIKTDGGYSLSERRIAVFLPDSEWQYELPIKLIKISPTDKRFLNALTHRDYLGALMNLGIERSLFGDIVVSDKIAYVFCLDRIASFIIDNLTKVRNDFVRCEMCDALPYDFVPSYKEITGSVASLRLDAVISLAFNESRSHSTGYIENALVFVNGRLITTNAYNLKDGDIVSVRGHGRFRYMYTKSETKKGRYMVVLNLYI